MAPKVPHRGAVKYRVLASAYACEPGLGSEPGIGWNWARQIAMHHELTLITRQNNVAEVRKAAVSQDIRMTVVGHDLSDKVMRWKKGSRGAMTYYYLWQKSLAGVAEALHSRNPFDVLHHLTFASGWIPSGLSTIDAPFVFGPVGQHPKIPSGFQDAANFVGRASENFRESARRLVPKMDAGVEATWEAADVILSLGRAFGDRLPELFRDKVRPMLACGIDSNHMVAPVPRAADEPLRVVFCGRLVELKGIKLALHAFALAAREANMTFDIVGEGPERPKLEAAIQKHGLGDRVKLHGRLSHEATMAAMKKAHVFLFPSFEGAGMVVPEAMASGAAVLCLDFGGPGEMCADGRGIAVPLERSSLETASEVATNLRRLERDELLRLSIAEVGQEWARHAATWKAKGAALSDIYGAAIDHHSARIRGVAA